MKRIFVLDSFRSVFTWITWIRKLMPALKLLAQKRKTLIQVSFRLLDQGWIRVGSDLDRGWIRSWSQSGLSP